MEEGREGGETGGDRRGRVPCGMALQRPQTGEGADVMTELAPQQGWRLKGVEARKASPPKPVSTQPGSVTPTKDGLCAVYAGV